jgi:short-subunit dehydrogenase
MDIRDKVVLITGASGGIGLVTARRFAAEGARLALVARSADALERLANELREQGHEAVAIRADMRDASQVRRAVENTVERFGRLDVLINNAGQGARGTIADVDPEHFHQIIELNIFGPVVAMQATIPVMRRQGGGLIINISSMTSKLQIPGIGAYAATKAALNKLSETARVELAPDNIRVVCVFPRVTATDFGANYLGNQNWRPPQHQRGQSFTVDSPEFVAEKILAAAVNETEEQYMD